MKEKIGRNPKASRSEKDAKGKAGTMEKYTISNFEDLIGSMRTAHDMNLGWASSARVSGNGFGFLSDEQIEFDDRFRCLMKIGIIKEDAK